jgi:hypothetical protein
LCFFVANPFVANLWHDRASLVASRIFKRTGSTRHADVEEGPALSDRRSFSLEISRDLANRTSPIGFAPDPYQRPLPLLDLKPERRRPQFGGRSGAVFHRM